MNTLFHVTDVGLVKIQSLVDGKPCSRRSLWLSRLFAGWIAVAALVSVSGLAETIRLTPDKSRGGSITNLADGTPAVSLLGEQSTTNHVTWLLDPPVPAGWSLVELELAATQNTDPESALVFGTPNKQLLILKYLPVLVRSNTEHQAWIYSSAPIKEVYLQKYWLGKLRTLPVRGINITPGGKPEKDSLLLIDIPIQGGVVKFPDELPSGNYAIHVPANLPRDGFTVRWKQDGEMAEASKIPARDFSIFTRSGISELSLTGATNFTGINLQRTPLPSAAWDIQTQHQRTLISPTLDKLHVGELILVSKTPLHSSATIADFPMGFKTAFIMSWDDGVQNDLRCAQALKKHAFRGTYFLVHSAPVLKVAASLEAMGMEVGSHTWSHVPLSQRDPDQAVAECVQMRKAIEEIVGHPIVSFAYPFGLIDGYDSHGNFVVNSAALAGYWSGRVTRDGQLNLLDNPNLMTLAPSGRWNDNTNALEAKWTLASQRPGGVFHIWGHSWEMVTEDDWTRLDHLLEEFGHRADTWYTTQGDVTVWNWIRTHARIEPVNVTPTRLVLQVTQPALHASLQTMPLTLKIPAEVDDVLWQGAHLKPEHGIVNLRWH
jgi:peptidoglycan/xylan/chitin deacetylase (PgdA/CDA1 family)